MAVTPGFRDVIWHLQFISVLGMTAVQWPNFACTSRVFQADDVHAANLPESLSCRPHPSHHFVVQPGRQ